jgi:Flp pilus assembly protein TadD
MKKILIISLISLSNCALLGLEGRDKAQRDDKLVTEINDFESPSVENTIYEAALKALEDGEYPKAEQYLKQLMKDSPENPDYLQKYADLGRRMGKCKVSVSIYDQLVRQDAGNLDYQEGRALCYLSMGEYEKAGRSFTEIMEKDATRWRSINGAGLIFISRKKLSEANQYFELASDVSGRDPTVLNNQGLTKALVGNYTDAIAVLEDASERSKDVPEQNRRVDLNLALVYGISGDFDSAKRVAEPHLTEPQLYNNLGIYSELAKQPELAKTYLNKALGATNIYYDRAWENLERLNKK